MGAGSRPKYSDLPQHVTSEPISTSVTAAAAQDAVDQDDTMMEEVPKQD